MKISMKNKSLLPIMNILFYGIIGLIVIIIVYLLWQMLFSNKNILLDSNITLNAGENYQLKVKEGYQIFYTSNNPNVVMVTDDGTIYAMNIGNAIITAKTTDGKSSNCKVTVKDVLVTDITLDQDNINLNKGDVTVLKATITPSDATRKNITWTSSDTSVVTVTNGRLKALSGGTAIITASTTDGKEATCNVTVTVPVVSIKLNETNVSLNKGEKTTLTATITPSDATNQTITWVSSDTSVVTVTDGKLEAQKYGTATITAKSSNGKEATCVVNVKSVVEGIALDKTTIDLNKGETATLTATITPNDASDKITWTSSDTSVVTVTDGKIKGIKAGTATITAKTTNGKTATCKVTVKIPVTKIKLNHTSGGLVVGATTTLTATVSPSDATDKSVKWTSSNTGVATVTNGIIKGISEGSVTITATASNGIKATCKIVVVKRNSTSTPTPTPTPTSSNSKIYFMNTGSSDAIIIESNGKFGLIDSSNPYNDGTAYAVSSTTESVVHVKNFLNKLGVSKLDFIVGTHSHSDHIGGMPVIAENFVDSNTTYYYKTYTGTNEDSTTDWDNRGYYNRAIAAMKKYGANMQEVTGKEPTITLGDFTIKLLNTDNDSNNSIGENQNSIVEYITYKGKYKTLLASDMESNDEGKVASKIGQVEILKIAHHSYTLSPTTQLATSFSFANSMSPKTAIITNNTIISRFIPVGYYMRQVLGTKFYLTGNTTDAIQINYSDSGYSVSAGDYNFNVTSTSGNWRMVNNTQWVLYKDGKVLHDTWYQDNDGKWYYLDSAGIYASNTCTTISGSYYCFNSSGACYKGNGC